LTVSFQWEFTKKLEDQTVPEKTSAVFDCEVTIKDFNVDWYVNNQKVEPGPKYQVDMDGKQHTLMINMCRPTDECEVKCAFGEAKTTAKLFVTRE
jgi:hypothetical protein